MKEQKQFITLQSNFVKMKKYFTKNSAQGITLISLVITIIVLLVLASTTVATLTGENGIITKAGEASEQTKVAGYKESIQLAVQDLVMDGSIFGDVDYPEKLQAEMQNYSNLQGATAQALGKKSVKVTTEDSYVYWVRESEITYAGKEGEFEDTTPPTASKANIEVTISEEGPTQGPVTVELKPIGDLSAYTIKYTENLDIDDDDWFTYSSKLTYSKNKTLYVALMNNGTRELGGYMPIEINNIDKLQPQPFTISTEDSTSTSITITGQTEDATETIDYAQNEIVEYKFAKSEEQSPEEWEWVNIPENKTNTTYEFTGLEQGKTYYFKMIAVDTVGNERESTNTLEQATIKVPNGTDKNPDNPSENIIKFTTTVEGEPWDENLTNKNIKVEVDQSAGDQFKIETSLTGNNPWSPYNEETGVVMAENGTVYARLREIRGNGTGEPATLTIDKIDKYVPKVTEVSTLSATPSSLTVTGIANDTSDDGSANSGIAKWYFKLDEGEWKEKADTELSSSYTFNYEDGYSTLKAGSSHTVYVKVEDKVGNVAQDTDMTKVGEKENATVTAMPLATKVTVVPTVADYARSVNVIISTTESTDTYQLQYIKGTVRPETPDTSWTDCENNTEITLTTEGEVVNARLKEKAGARQVTQATTYADSYVDITGPDVSNLTLTVPEDLITETTITLNLSGEATDRGVGKLAENKYQYMLGKDAENATPNGNRTDETTHTFENQPKETDIWLGVSVFDSLRKLKL